MTKINLLQLIAVMLLCCYSNSTLASPEKRLFDRKDFFQNTQQNARLITGRVTAAPGDSALTGATISVKGTRTTTRTDAEGNFSIAINSDNAILVVSFVGYATQEVPTAGQSTINIALQVLTSDLANVVVVGYGSQNRRDVTGAVKSVKAESFNKGIITSPEQLLQGKVSGVNVTSASGEPGVITGITIRGPGGVRTGSTPLFVVDGLALDNSSTGGGNPLNFLNPQDIESMDVLKDASATAIYGSRGANGVILITTKRGRAGTSSLVFSSNVGLSTIANPIEVFDAARYRAEVNKIGGTLLDKGASTDWQKEITRTAFTQNQNLSFSGGSRGLTYYASFNMQRQEGILKNNNLNRYTGRFNVTQRFLDDRLVVEANMNATNTYNQRPNIGAVIGEALSGNPTYPAYDSSGKPAQYQDMNNPLVTMNLEKDLTKINRIIGNISPSLRIIKGLIYKLNFGVDVSNGTRDIQSLPNAIPQRDGRLETYYTYNRNTLFENYLTYNFDVKDHAFSVLAGYSYQKIFLQGRNYSINKFPIGSVEPIYNPGLGQELTLANNKPGGYALINELQSFFGRINYSYQNKYLLTINMRADGSSKFGENNKYGFFPSFSAGWRISEESFMEGSIFSNLKLRAGWGLTGNQEIPSKITQPLYTSTVSASTSYPLSPSGPYPAGTTFSRLANPDIQWEVSNQVDVGLDFGLFGGRLNGTIDYFRKVSSNILLEVIPADPIQPAGTVWTNVKDMTITNQGLEFDLEYRDQTASGFQYGVGGNMTFIKNIVENSPYSVIPSGSASGSGLTSATINGYINGEPIGTFYLKDFIGFDTAGMNKFRDKDNDGIISDKDRFPMGSALPKTMYNFFFNLGYKGFDLAVNFNGVTGNMIYDNTANANFYKLRLYKGINTTAEAVQYPEENVNNAAPVSSRYLKEGGYFRLNNAALGYNFNTGAWKSKGWLKGLRVSVTGQNLWLITKYDGYDPEVNTDRSINGITSNGIDYLSYPKARSFILGVNVSF
ncbi:TonB-dependent receptor [Pollutibacter soli]|uniref:SusC/RagA family TonB-linked outer membrane protein n=1 Tax=Pollutibacter soli TaxID=3034157 RepID=UPI003013D89A